MFVYFFFNNTATTEIYTYFHTLALLVALPFSAWGGGWSVLRSGLWRRAARSVPRIGSDRRARAGRQCRARRLFGRQSCRELCPPSIARIRVAPRYRRHETTRLLGQRDRPEDRPFA